MIVKNLLSQSPSFCLAKWCHLSLHLDRGTGHSCYHNPEEKIPEENLLSNPSLLHNTHLKSLERKMMLKGERPSGCLYCWRQEDATTTKNSSDRIIYSQSSWASPYANEIIKDPTSNVNPSYLEVSFSNTCQLKCSYCGPHNSSSWKSEIIKYGNYTNRLFPARQDNFDNSKYIEAFWAWWPDLVKRLQVFRITGGEPLLSQETWQVLDHLHNDPMPHLELYINSNLSFDKSIIDKLCKKINNLIDTNSIKKVTIVTSLEAIDAAAKYIRFGIDLEYFWANVSQILNSNSAISVSVTSTIQVLSADSFIDFLKFFLNYRTQNQLTNLTFDPSPIVYPLFMRLENLPELEKSIFCKDLEKIIENRGSELREKEIFKIKNLISILKCHVSQEDITSSRKNFYNYYSAYDKIRNLDFVSTFPNLKNYWIESKSQI